MVKKQKSKDYAYRRGPIAVVNSQTGAMQCLNCGQKWVSNIRPRSGGQYYRGSWTCSRCGANRKDKFTPK
jgi:transposase-like protein